MFQMIFGLITSLLSKMGYLGVCLFMTLESMIFPVPSEAVMPFSGFLIHSGQFTWLGILFWSTIGSFIGSGLSYAMGSYGGRPFLQKYGKYFLINDHHMKLSEDFFEKYGDKAILISRFLPVIRHFISIPAGICRMNFLKFSIYTVIGASCWNMFLAYVGFKLKENWQVVGHYMHYADYALVLGVLIFGVYWFLKKKQNKK